MAKINDSSSPMQWFGPKSNTKQIQLAIPAGPSGDDPGLLYLESSSSAAVKGGIFLWSSSVGDLRVSATKPTDEDADGFALDNTTIGAATTKQLDNLSGVAVNTSIVSDADDTDSLGSSSIYWAATYNVINYLNATAYFTGTTGTATLTGKLTVGVDDTGHDVQFFGAATGSYMLWDESVDDLVLMDDCKLAFGDDTTDGRDFNMSWDGTDLAITALADDTVVRSGAATDIDWVWESKTTAGDDMGWIADEARLHIADGSSLCFGGAAVLTYDDGFEIGFDKDKTLNIDPTNANDVVRLGETNVGDLYLDGANYDINWDGSESELVFNDDAKLVFGGAAGAGTDDLIIASDGDITNFTFGAADNGIVMTAYAAQTTSVLDIDSDSNNWSGADVVGMLHLRADAALAHRGASLFYIDNSGKPIANADGFMARLLDNSTNTASTFAVEMFSNANNLMEMHTGAVGVTPLTIAPHTNATASAIAVDCYTDGFVGAANTGLVNINAKGTLAATTASLLHVNPTGAYYAAGEGGALFINDDKTASGTNYSVYVNSNAVHCMKLETGNVAMTALVLEPKTSATAAALIVDGDANGWIGADNIGMVHIQNDVALDKVLASMLMIDNTGQPKASALGFALKILDAGAARADTYCMEINSTNNEAIKITAGNVLFADAQQLQFGTAAEWKIYNDGTNSITVLGTDDWLVGSATTNYTQFAVTSGKLSFAGTAQPTKDIWLPAKVFDILVGSPAIGIPTGCKFNGFALRGETSDESIATVFSVPEDWGTSDVNAYIYYCSSDTNTANTRWDVATSAFAENENMAVAHTQTDSATDAAISTTAYDLNVTAAISITASTEWVAGDVIALTINRDQDHSGDNNAGDVFLIGVKLTYSADQV